MKCDEGKPTCERCIRFGALCDGYSKPAQPTRRISLLPILPRFADEQESRFFSIYVQNTAIEIAGPFRSVLWSQLIPQASESESYIRQIVSAISASNQASRIDASDSRRSQTEHFALKQYGKALSGIRAAISDGKRNMRHALIACLLVYCFESLQGDATSAARNARAGLKFLEEWMTSYIEWNPAFVPSLGRRQSEPPGKIADVEAEILQTFGQLDTQVLSLADEPPQPHLSAFMSSYFEDDFMMACFKTLEQSRNYWMMLQRRNYNFAAVAFDTAMSKRSAIATGDKTNVETQRAKMEECREDVRRWSRASEEVFSLIEMRGTADEKTVMNILKIHAILNHIQMAASFFRTDLEYDDFLSEYTSIVTLSEEVYPVLVSKPTSDSRIGGLFHIDPGIIYVSPHLNVSGLGMELVGPWFKH